MINRPFEGSLHNDLGIMEATDETLSLYTSKNHNQENIDLLTALNNYTARTDSPEGREQLLKAVDELEALIHRYGVMIKESLELAKQQILNYPLITTETGNKLIAEMKQTLVESLAGEVAAIFGNIFTAPAVFKVSKQLLNLGPIPHVTHVFFYIREDAKELNKLSEKRFIRSTESEQIHQFHNIMDRISEEVRLKARESLNGISVEES